jgi:hypothetical protein
MSVFYCLSLSVSTFETSLGCIWLTNSWTKRGVVQHYSKSWEQILLSLTPDVLHSLQAMGLCRMLVERGIDINHGDVAWSSLAVKLQGQWPSLPPEPTFRNMSKALIKSVYPHLGWPTLSWTKIKMINICGSQSLACWQIHDYLTQYILPNTRIYWPIFVQENRPAFLNGLLISIQLCRQFCPPFRFRLRCGLWEWRKCTEVARPSCCLSCWGDNLPRANQWWGW